MSNKEDEDDKQEEEDDIRNIFYFVDLHLFFPLLFRSFLNIILTNFQGSGILCTVLQRFVAHLDEHGTNAEGENLFFF